VRVAEDCATFHVPVSGAKRSSPEDASRSRHASLVCGSRPTEDRNSLPRKLFSSAIAANVIRRFKFTCRRFSKRMAAMTIMHEPHVAGEPSLTV
jgi:hypothetical protein